MLPWRQYVHHCLENFFFLCSLSCGDRSPLPDSTYATYYNARYILGVLVYYVIMGSGQSPAWAGGIES